MNSHGKQAPLTSWLLPLGGRHLPASAGLKARNLRRLLDGGWPVPPSHVLTWEAYERHRSGDEAVLAAVRRELETVLAPERAYAVRSSASVEDAVGASFAGQFRTLLGVRGTEAVVEAVRSVWDAVAADGVSTYAERSGVGDSLRMAVLIQEMVDAKMAGVVFSHDPVTGERNAVVEAVEGVGEALVQRGAAPERWVRAKDDWQERPAGALLPEPVALSLAATATAIADRVRKPVDLEWAWEGRQVYWLQLRELAAITRVPVYSNRMAMDVLPGVIAPLQWSGPSQLVISAWLRLFAELLGPVQARPEDLARLFSYHAYFNMATIGDLQEQAGLPRDAMEKIQGMKKSSRSMRPRLKPALLPRLTRFGWKMFRLAPSFERWYAHALGEHAAIARAVDLGDEPGLLAGLARAQALAAETAYHAIVVPFNTYLYDRLLQRQLAGVGADVASLDIAADLPELAELDPNRQLSRLRELAAGLPEGTRARLADCRWPDLATLDGTEELRSALADFLARFGHLGPNGNDVTVPTWREEPEQVLRLAAQSAAAASPRARVRFSSVPLSWPRRLLAAPLYRRAARFRLYREQVSSAYAKAVKLLREHYLAVGRLLALRGVVDTAEDIFLLYEDEVRQAIAGTDAGAVDWRARVITRRKEMATAQDAVLPSRFVGEAPGPWRPPEATVLRGAPASRGRYTGRVRVARRIDELWQLAQGEVLVIAYSDVSWTPYFAKAGAVVAETGGLLSHSAIVAREYGLPAVVSVEGACHLRDGTLVNVDGYSGEVVVLESAPVFAPVVQAPAESAAE